MQTLFDNLKPVAIMIHPWLIILAGLSIFITLACFTGLIATRTHHGPKNRGRIYLWLRRRQRRKASSSQAVGTEKNQQTTEGET